MNLSRYITCLLAFSLVFGACSKTAETPDFARVENGRFIKHGTPYYYIGTNFWYGAILGSTGTGGDRDRLLRELDFLKANGIDNLRILAGADGPARPSKVSPSLQLEPGVYNDTILDGLDFLLAEMGKREMSAVLYLTNSWEWSGGYSQYIEWVTGEKAPVPSVDGWNAFSQYVTQFVQNDRCKELVKEHASFLIGRTNRYTGLKYTDDPTIFSWQIGNEPRAFSEAGKPLYAAWMKDLAAHIKSLDPNHLVSTGSEGLCGTEGDIALWEEIHAIPAIDYTTIHIWPNNWGWMDKQNVGGNMERVISNTSDYIEQHLALARKMQKPMVLEEFGFPRDGMLFAPGTPTTARDRYFTWIFDRIADSARGGDFFAGCNIWAWGGFGRPADGHIFWETGDDYLGDPAQEEQGLNSVFDTDSIVPLIRQYNEALRIP